MNLIIDIGNTAAKLAAFRGEELVEVIYDDNHRLSALADFAHKYSFRRAMLATVIDLTPEAEAALGHLPCPLRRLDASTPLPIANLYETPQTLGYDRIAAVVGAQSIFPGRDILVIDAGTCITYEFIDAQGRYHGGNISPGLQMRLRALHQFTSRLPLVEAEGRLPDIDNPEASLQVGADTETAIRAGVKQGMKYEIEGYIRALRHKYSELLTFLTGGDDFSFDTKLKSIIFADRFLVLKGLNRILNYSDDRI